MINKPLTVIIGLGKTGLSCARFLTEKNQPFAVMDSREEPLEFKNFIKTYSQAEVICGQFSEKLLNDAQEIILSPGVSLQEPLIAKQIAKGKSVISDIELFARTINKPIIAITGSNGKTTLATVMGLMMKAAGRNVAICGNIGEPALEQVDSKSDYYVLELSSFQLETTFSLKSQVATILNISEDHMNRYVTFQDYLHAKQRIYAHCNTPIVNADEPGIWWNLSFNEKPLSFGLNSSADFSLVEKNRQIVITYRNQTLISVQELKLNTRHHLQNALAALALGKAIGLSTEVMLRILREFLGIRHRCQWVRKYKGVDYYNDSKGTNVGATQAAIKSLGQTAKGRLILIAGGQGKAANFFPLKDSIRRHVKQVILIGEDAPLLEKTLKGITVIKQANSMNKAIEQAVKAAQVGDIVLLSPACASFDMFKNYEHRGDVFIELVEAL